MRIEPSSFRSDKRPAAFPNLYAFLMPIRIAVFLIFSFLFGALIHPLLGFDFSLPKPSDSHIPGRGFLEISRLKKRLEREPANSKYLVEIGAILVERGQFKQASTYFQSALRRRYQSPVLEYFLGLLATREKHYIPAEKHLKRALSLGKQKISEHFVALSQLYLDSHQYSKGLRWAALGLKLHPHSARLRVLASYHLIKLERYTEAELTLLASRRLRPQDPEIPYNLACLYANLKDQDAVIYNLKKAARNGYFKPEYPQLEPVFQPFRTHPQFLLALEHIRDNERKFKDVNKLNYRANEKTGPSKEK